MSDWDDVSDALKKASTVIKDALDGPGGPVIQIALKSAVQALVGKRDPEDILKALTAATPDEIDKIEDFVRDTENDLLRQHVEVTTNPAVFPQVSGESIIAPVVISSVVLVGLFGLASALFFIDMSKFAEVQAEIIRSIFNALIPLASAVVFYWVGSSRGSQTKDAALANSVPVTAIPVLKAPGK